MLKLKKSLSEKIYLLSAKQVNKSEWNFSLRGQSLNIYSQILRPDFYSCSCPDHSTRNNFCKHLLFLVSRVAIQMELAASISMDKNKWNADAFNACVPSWINRLKCHIAKKGTVKPINEKAVGSDCSICFETITDKDVLSQCIKTCKNYFHQDCIKRWLETDHDTCPLCRSEWVEPTSTKTPEEAISSSITVDILSEEKPKKECKKKASTPVPASVAVPAPAAVEVKKGRKKKETIVIEVSPSVPAVSSVETKKGRKKKETTVPEPVTVVVPEPVTVVVPEPVTVVVPEPVTVVVPAKKGRKKKTETTTPEVVETPATVEATTPEVVDTPVSVEAVPPAVIKTDIVFSFDTTGSMHPCLEEVKRNIGEIIPKLFNEVPDLRIAIIAHGDYCDGKDTIKTLDFTDDKNKIIDFVKKAPRTGGGDYPECYELVLHNTKDLSWRFDATMKSLIMIGDAIPHDKNSNPHKINWKEECDKLNVRNIQVYSVQCLNSGDSEAYEFYSTVANKTNGYHLFLDQFSYIKDMIQAICFRQYNKECLEKFETELQGRSGGMNSSLRMMFDTMLGRKTREQVAAEMRPAAFRERYRSMATTSSSRTSRRIIDDSSPVSESDLRPCVPTRFQVLNVERDMGIKEFCDTMGIRFERGRGFYEFTKPEIIQNGKEIVLMDKETGNLYEGDVARRIAGISRNDDKARLKPGTGAMTKYRVFIQSTSVTRILIGGQGFLYEVSAEH
jgi:hypothetical protein